jgi:ubiquinone biosynthesis protein UbiJ
LSGVVGDYSQAADKSSKAVDSSAKSVNKATKDVHKAVSKALTGEKEKDNKHLKEIAAAVPSVVIIVTGACV